MPGRASAVGKDLGSLRLSDAVAICTTLRHSTKDALSMEAAAQAVVRHLRTAFVDPETGKPAFVLARLFQTEELQHLPADLRERATHDGPLTESARVLTLLATEGDLPEWCDRRRSQDHQAIPVSSPELVANAPMISALIRGLGLDVDAVVTGATERDVLRADFDVFHVQEAEGAESVPGQQFVREHGVRSVLGFGGVLPSGHVFSVVMFSRVAIPVETARLFRTIAVSVKLALMPFVGAVLFVDHPRLTRHRPLSAAGQVRALKEMLDVHERTAVEQAAALEERDEQLRREAEIVETLRRAGEALSSDLDMDAVVQMTTTAAIEVTGAQFGAFFYNVVDEHGESYMLYTLAGAPRSAFEKFPMPRNTDIFAPTFAGEGVVRSDDITAEPHYGRVAPYHGMPPGHLPVHSYLAVPVISPTSGEVLGGLFCGHERRAVFDDRAERLAVGIAAQTGIALDNALLYRRERDVALQLQQALLPTTLEPPPYLSIAHRYRPGTTGLHVGGDWYDLVRYGDGRTGLVIGDVMGRGVRAAATMGQLRSSIRAFAALNLPPAEMTTQLNQIVLDLPDEQIATFFLAVYEPERRRLDMASAGHLPPIVIGPDGIAAAHQLDLGPPLGIPGAEFLEHSIVVAPGTAIVLYTDGLVESRNRSADDGIRQLESLLTSLHATPDEACAKLLGSLPDAAGDDDIALLYARFA